MDIKEQVAQANAINTLGKSWYSLSEEEQNYMLFTADQIIPLVRADTLRSISKESKRMDGTIYLVPDYTKFREAIKEAGIEEKK